MIRYLREEEKERSRKLYEEAFPEDPEEFVDYYYGCHTKDNQILVLEQNGKICSMLHLNPYTQVVNGHEVSAYYYVAVATAEDCRHQGMMRKLIYRSLRDIRKQEQPYTYLMPANRAIYEPFDFRIVYEQKRVDLPLEAETANELLSKKYDIYTKWDSSYVEKLKEERRICGDNPPFEIIPYIMMRITHVEKMLELLRSETPIQIVLDVTDVIIEENDGRFLWEVSERESSCRTLADEEDPEIPVITVSIAELTEFVFGRRRIPKLESIHTLNRICINESV
ncbi:MAG: GNAT family N-acetyltransferase [Lachnospiraceae bacterium]